ncbi:MAG: hypothetical protein ABIJ27_08460 [Candidatus Omnitrophota bacterium]
MKRSICYFLIGILLATLSGCAVIQPITQLAGGTIGAATSIVKTTVQGVTGLAGTVVKSAAKVAVPAAKGAAMAAPFL